MALDRGAGRGLNLEAELGGESHRAHHADRIFAHPQFRVADGANQARLEVVNATGKIDNLKTLRTVEQRVDGEVAAERVFLRGAKSVVETNQRILALGDCLGLAAES